MFNSLKHKLFCFSTAAMPAYKGGDTCVNYLGLYGVAMTCFSNMNTFFSKK